MAKEYRIVIQLKTGLFLCRLESISEKYLGGSKQRIPEGYIGVNRNAMREAIDIEYSIHDIIAQWKEEIPQSKDLVGWD